MKGPFEFAFTGQVWQAFPAGEEGLWILEIRRKDAREVSYAAVDFGRAAKGADGKLWEVQVEGTDWWTSLAGAGRRRFYLHNFRNPEIPEATDLLVADIQSGKLAQVLPGYWFTGMRGEGKAGVAARQGDRTLPAEYEEHTGAVKPAEGAAGEAGIVLQPVRYREGDPYFEEVVSFLDKTVNAKQVKVVDYQESDPYMVFSYDVYENDILVQYLAVIDRWKKVKYHQQIASEIKGTRHDTFLLKNDTLVFLKKVNIFAGINLAD